MILDGGEVFVLSLNDPFCKHLLRYFCVSDMVLRADIEDQSSWPLPASQHCIPGKDHIQKALTCSSKRPPAF